MNRLDFRIDMRKALFSIVFGAIALMLFATFGLKGLPHRLSLMAGLVCVAGGVVIDQRSRHPQSSKASHAVAALASILAIVFLWFPTGSIANGLFAVCVATSIAAGMFRRSTAGPNGV